MMNNGFISPLKFLSLSFCLTCLPSNTQAINIYPPIITSNQQQQNKQTESPEVGLEIIGSPSLNRLVIPMYRYTGECPGFSKGIVRASFTSTAFPPSRDRRVIVRNVSRGVASDPFPFTEIGLVEDKLPSENALRDSILFVRIREILCYNCFLSR